MTTEKFKWQGIVSKYAFPETWRSAWQVFNSVIPFIVMWYIMVRSLEVGYWLTLILAVPTAGFMMRCFIIFHDCCHGSFFKTMKANDRLGLVIGVLVITPFYQWKHSHAIHHATAGDLDRRTRAAHRGNEERHRRDPVWRRDLSVRIFQWRLRASHQRRAHPSSRRPRDLRQQCAHRRQQLRLRRRHLPEARRR